MNSITEIKEAVLADYIQEIQNYSKDRLVQELIIIKTMAQLDNIHPGEVLQEEFLSPLEISAYRLSKDLNIPQTRVSQILHKKRRITADTALRLSKYFGNSAKFWLGLQDDFDLEEEEREKNLELEQIKLFENNAA